jgi:hypothetical protein
MKLNHFAHKAIHKNAHGASVLDLKKKKKDCRMSLNAIYRVVGLMENLVSKDTATLCLNYFSVNVDFSH